MQHCSEKVMLDSTDVGPCSLCQDRILSRIWRFSTVGRKRFGLCMNPGILNPYFTKMCLWCVLKTTSLSIWNKLLFRSHWKAEYLFCSFFGRTDTICCISQHYLGFWPRIAALHTPHEGIGALRVSCWMRSWDCQGSQADDVDVYIHAYDRSTR